MDKQMYDTLMERAKRLKVKVAEHIGAIVGGNFLLAGGALTKDDNPKDFDIYGVGKPIAIDSLNYLHTVKETRNAITARIDGQVVQFCKYHKPTPQELVESFDFAHCKAGAVFNKSGELLNVVSTSSFEIYERAGGSTWYTGSEYPLSSLMRCMKFQKRGMFRDYDYKPVVVSILCDIIRRGFKDMDDYIDQCASISEAFAEIGCNDSEELFELLLKNKAESEVR